MPEGSTNSEQTKKRLIEAAGEVFAKNGFRASTVRQICKRARANIGSVNYHFRNKKGLYEATFAYMRQLALSKYPPDLGLSRNPTTEEKLHAFIRAFLLRLMAEGLPAWYGKLIAQEIANPSGALDQVIENSIRPFYRNLAEIVRELTHEKVSPDGEYGEATFLAAHSIMGQCLHHYIARDIIEALRPRSFDPTRIDQIADHIMRFSLGGIRELSAGAHPPG
jgi:AcrR family transcriptional regulator